MSPLGTTPRSMSQLLVAHLNKCSFLMMVATPHTYLSSLTFGPSLQRRSLIVSAPCSSLLTTLSILRKLILFVSNGFLLAKSKSQKFHSLTLLPLTTKRMFQHKLTFKLLALQKVTVVMSMLMLLWLVLTALHTPSQSLASSTLKLVSSSIKWFPELRIPTTWRYQWVLLMLSLPLLIKPWQLVKALTIFFIPLLTTTVSTLLLYVTSLRTLLHGLATKK